MHVAASVTEMHRDDNEASGPDEETPSALSDLTIPEQPAMVS
jgi:hypothetical protein